MATSCDDGRFACLLVNKVGKGDALQDGYFFIVPVILGLIPVGARYYGPTQVLLPFGDFLPLLIKLPALLIIASVVKKFATIPNFTPSCRLPIFAYVGGAKSVTIVVRIFVEVWVEHIFVLSSNQLLPFVESFVA